MDIKPIDFVIGSSIAGAIFLIVVAYTYFATDFFEPPLSQEEVMEEYDRLLQERNDIMEELLDVMELRNKMLLGEAHST